MNIRPETIALARELIELIRLGERQPLPMLSADEPVYPAPFTLADQLERGLSALERR